MTKYFDTEGEKIIEFFLEDERIQYKKQIKIEKLKSDYADYRTPDFYLPKYKVYLEFLGKWNNAESKAKYMQKKEIYEKNRIPCIYIYPDNLGTLKYLFYMRLRDEFKKYPELKFQFLKYKFSTVSRMLGGIWLGFYIMSILIVFLVNLPELGLTVTPMVTLLFSVLLLSAIVLSIHCIRAIFSKDKESDSPEENLK